MPVESWMEIARFGKKVVQAGLTTSRFGNISVLRGDIIFITCTGSMLDELCEDQIIDVDLSRSCMKDNVASTEVCVHRAIYNKTSAKAIIHTHSPYAVALSLLEDEIEPIDSEGKHFMGPVPVVDGGFGTEMLAENASSALASHNVCIARGHGAFAVGKGLSEAYTMACMVEHSSQVRYLVNTYKRLNY